MTGALADIAGRLRRAYLDKEETDAPLPKGTRRDDRGGFSFDGHRLASLYRGDRIGWRRLTNPCASSLQKYACALVTAYTTSTGGTT